MLPDNPISTVLLYIAMEAELVPLAERIGLVEDPTPGFPPGVPWVKYSGVYKNLHIHAIRPGTDDFFGGYKRKGAQIGDVYMVTEATNHDRRIPNFIGYGVGALKATPAPNLVNELSLKEGKLSTGNSLDIIPQDEEIILANDATLKDMEGAAIAYVADLLPIPLILIKAVTDIVDGDRPTIEEFLENLSTATHALNSTLPMVLDHLVDRSLNAL